MDTSDLFAAAATKSRIGQPLAERMRPDTLAHMLGQEALLGPGGPLARWVRAKQAPSLIIWGPPGSGKTTLAHALARAHGATLTTLSAVSAGVREVREVVEAARTARNHHGRATWLFIDEIHRFNRAQQDALLPHVESGLVTFLGATTQNPAFEVNNALLSRCRVLQLQALPQEAMAALLARALGDVERGLGQHHLSAAPEVLAAIARHSDGDARRALGTLEAAAAMTRADGRTAISRDDVAQGSQDRWIGHDRDGEAHYQLLSALIKSMRHSDANAAVYYLARLLQAGEPPRTVARRMVIFASEDIGGADPSALSVAVAALQALEFVGLPEGTLPLTQLAIHLAHAPKSRTVPEAYSAASQAVAEHGPLPVPAHLTPTGGPDAHAPHRVRARPMGATAPGQSNLPNELRNAMFVGPEKN